MEFHETVTAAAQWEMRRAMTLGRRPESSEMRSRLRLRSRRSPIAWVPLASAGSHEKSALARGQWHPVAQGDFRLGALAISDSAASAQLVAGVLMN